MRGKGSKSSVDAGKYRITPAYAGKSTTPVQTARGTWDHPRLCGEKHREWLSNQHMQGSPPPMRGKAEALAVADLLVGITPAYAGKRTQNYYHGLLFWDHPRLCGEKVSHCKTLLRYRGSPPPMRGKADLMSYHISYCRITPAYAGKSFSVKICLFGNKDHPRLCGEKPFL